MEHLHILSILLFDLIVVSILWFGFTKHVIQKMFLDKIRIYYLFGKTINSGKDIVFDGPDKILIKSGFLKIIYKIETKKRGCLEYITITLFSFPGKLEIIFLNSDVSKIFFLGNNINFKKYDKHKIEEVECILAAVRKARQKEVIIQSSST